VALNAGPRDRGQGVDSHASQRPTAQPAENSVAEAGRADVMPDAPVTWVTTAHQSRSHDDFTPLATPLPMHLARLAADYVLPTESDSQRY
jgi:hypothetical protein